jgi:hypothetical protein
MVADARKLSVGGYLIIGSLTALLAAVIVFAGLAWSLGAEANVPGYGYAAMAAGILFSLVVGIGLMALCFCSSRFGFDEPTKSVQPDSHDRSPEDRRSR